MRVTPTAKEIFFAALDMPAEADRVAYLAKACGDDADLRSHVEALLAAHDESDSRFDQPSREVESVPNAIPSAGSEEWIGAQIGPYKLRELLGEGGMGVVYVAEQTEPVRRKVALKIIKPGMDSRQVIARFEAERQALAMMDHPNIARILDAGTTGEKDESGRRKDGGQASDSSFITHPSSFASSGRPYFVMELVVGLPITEYCDQAQLTPRERLEIFVAVCQAVQHAHQKGIIHRDLKPSNVLVTLHDGVPVVKVIDFGVAKALNQKLTDQTLYTGVTQLLGTPLYMSPEQAEMSGLDVDTRSDVYSLGVLLYELLIGQTPFDSAALRQAGFDEMRRLIREVDPPRPSQRFSTLGTAASSTASQRRGLDQRQLRRALRSELDWIVMKCLEKDRSRRYESASALAGDIRRFLANEPVVARPASVGYRLRKWIRRHPTTAIVATVSSLAILALVLGGGYYNHHLNTANHRLDTANHDLNRANHDLSSALSVSKRLETEAVERERQLRLQRYADDMRTAWKAWDASDTDEALKLLLRHQPQPGHADLRGFEWHYLFAHYQPPLRTLRGHADPILTADVSPNEQWIASGDKGGAVKIWELAAGREVKTLQYSTQEVTSVCFAPDGRTLATAGMDRTIRLWNVDDWSEAACLRGHELTVTSVAWSPDGKQLASAGRDHRVKIWDVASQRETNTLPDYPDVVRCVAWSPDGKVLAAAVRENGLHLWSATTWRPLKTFQEPALGGILALSFSADSKRLASSGYGGHLVVHDIAKGTKVTELDALEQVSSLRFSPDGSLLVAGMFNGGILLCDVDAKEGTLSEPRTIQIGQGKVQAVAFANRGETLVTALELDRVIEVRSTAQLADRHRRYKYYTTCISVAPTGDRAVLMDKNGVARLVTFPPKDSLGVLSVPKGRRTLDAAFFPQGDRLALCVEWHVRLYDSVTKRYLGDLEDSKYNMRTLTVSPNGKYIAGTGDAGQDFRVCIWDADTRAVIRSLEAHDKDSNVQLAFSPDGDLLATAPWAEPSIRLWNVVTGERIAELPFTPHSMDVAFSPDGQTLAAAAESSVWLWDVASRSQLAVLRGHEGTIYGIAFSPNGQTLATIGQDGSARLWHVATRQELCILARRALPIIWLQFRSPSQLVIGTGPDPQSPAGANDVLVFDAGDPADGEPNRALAAPSAAARP
jgi:eukaryotic-like serine/threonine-protein kinase